MCVSVQRLSVSLCLCLCVCVCVSRSRVHPLGPRAWKPAPSTWQEVYPAQRKLGPRPEETGLELTWAFGLRPRNIMWLSGVRFGRFVTDLGTQMPRVLGFGNWQ